MKNCESCGKEISYAEFNNNNGQCTKCYLLKRNSNVDIRKNNIVATIIKGLAVITAIIGIILGNIEMLLIEEIKMPFIICSIILSIFIFAIGEIIQLLEDIKNK